MTATFASGKPRAKAHVGAYRATSQIPVSAWVPSEDATPACASVDPDIFYPEPGLEGHSRRTALQDARRVCAGCGLRERCETAAVAQEERHGVWGGKSPRERGVTRSN